MEDRVTVASLALHAVIEPIFKEVRRYIDNLIVVDISYYVYIYIVNYKVKRFYYFSFSHLLFVVGI